MPRPHRENDELDQFDNNHIQVDPATFSKKRKRNNAACARCHERKIKCDSAASPNTACKNCNAAGVSCTMHIDGRTRTGPLQTTMDQDGSLSGSGPILAPGLAMPPAVPLPIVQPTPMQHMPVTQPSTHAPIPPSVHTRTQISAMLRSPSPVQQADLSLRRFETYVDDNMGAFAPVFRSSSSRAQPPPSLPPPHSTAHSLQDTPGSYTLPSPVSQSQSQSQNQHSITVEMTSRNTMDLERAYTELDAGDRAYLESKGVFDLPARALQRDLIEAFFADVHPTAPVLDRRAFMDDFNAGRHQSRLLLFAIFTGAARACRNPELLDDARGTNHAAGTRFFKATSALLATGYERDRLAIVQALLMITWWWDKKDDGGRNMRSCAVDAVNTAQSLGMHRWDHYPPPGPLRGLWKRIWWSCVNRDAGVAVAHGLPCMITLEDTDVPPLTPDDFNEDPGGAVGGQWASYSEEEVMFMIEQARVSEASRYIQSDYFVRQRLDGRLLGTIAEREAQVAAAAAGRSMPGSVPSSLPGSVYSPGRRQLSDGTDLGLHLSRQWLRRIPDSMRYDVDDIKGHRFWPAFLHILYFTNIMLRFREMSMSKPVRATGRTVAEIEFCRARGIAAANMVYKTLRNLRSHNQTLRCTGQLTISLFNCMSYFLVEHQLQGGEVRDDAKRKYSFCLHQLYDFSQLWISASLVHRLFEELQPMLLQQRSSSRTPGTPSTAAAASSSSSSSGEHRLFPGLKTSSAVPLAYMWRLIESDFYYNENSDSNSCSAGPPSWPAVPSPEDVFSMSLDQPYFGGLPDNLNVESWFNFFQMDDGKYFF